ncbi:MAG: 50S ribosomal protein L28 [Thermoanaerobaculia bacterium]|jgi:large subunit ribosomal protein L28|nr:50S ribosomal protein L28 [Thermoanaerobaculia bacterium]HMM34846.1 50S ribosomal protein L28 [Thermoanaerobaculia bacterium]HPA52213.1 50S ribosomal protein L28 [Thermoanaerobaculia bacterium]HQN06445.1 50S ribosomal protein L28 [Thermoanaerobaculia bacterium]HQP86845.1 50S ribosomal protein L28 [Thermoanaerobaculia bacterium]
MPQMCEVCGKAPVAGRRVSHAHNVTNRQFKPNLRRVRAAVPGGSKRVTVCTRCLRSDKITKVVR